jgi:multidrug efflux system membrane fusion protein
MKVKIIDLKTDHLCRNAGLYFLTAVLLMGCWQNEPQVTPPLPQVSTMKAASSNLEITEDLPGRVTAVRTAEIRPQISGIVQRRLFEQGTEVLAGQPLFQINPAPFRAEVDIAAATLQRAEVALNHARVQTARLQPLVKVDAITRQVYDDAAAQRDQAVADVAQAKATLVRRQLDLKFATVEAPISGRIDQALITEGALVSSADSTPMARIQQIDQVYVDVRCPASSLEGLREALSMEKASSESGLPVGILRSNGEPYAVKGRMLFSGVHVDDGTGDVLLRVVVDNPLRLFLPGMFVRARVPHASYTDAITVPQQSVVRVGSQPHVWTINASNYAHLNPVELGELVDRRYRIRTGLSLGQKIVVEGMERLSDGVKVAAHDWITPGLSQALSVR